MTTLTLRKKDRHLRGDIHLDGSKSISNRVLLIRALCDTDFEVEGLSTSNDTQTMLRLLAEEPEVFDCGAAGTTLARVRVLRYISLSNKLQHRRRHLYELGKI